MPGSQRLPPWPDLAPLQPVFEAANIIGLFEWDIAADRLFPCLGMARLFGLDLSVIRQGALPSDLLGALHPDDRATFARRAGHVRHAVARTEYRVVAHSGTERPILELMRLSPGPLGAPDWACGALFDDPGTGPAFSNRTPRTIVESLDRAAVLAMELRRTVDDLDTPHLKRLVDIVLIEIAQALGRKIRQQSDTVLH